MLFNMIALMCACLLVLFLTGLPKCKKKQNEDIGIKNNNEKMITNDDEIENDTLTELSNMESDAHKVTLVSSASFRPDNKIHDNLNNNTSLVTKSPSFFFIPNSSSRLTEIEN